MKELKALVDLISRNKIKRIEVAGFTGTGKTKIHKLYKAIAENQFEKEEEAAAYLFSGNKRKDYYFQRLKRQLKDRLINTLFFIDANQPTFNDFQRAYYTCYKNVTAVKIMLGRHARAAAIPLAEQTLKKAMNFEFTDLIFELSKVLSSHYANIIGDSRKYLEYQALNTRYRNIYLSETLAEQYYVDISFHYAKSNATKQEVSEMAVKYFQELELIPEQNRSYRFYYLYFFTSIARYESISDYPNTLLISKEALKYFEKQRHHSSSNLNFYITFLNRSLACHIYLGQFTEGEANILRLLEIHAEGSLGWYNTLMYQMILCFHSGQYQKTLKILNQAITNKGFVHLNPNTIEFWRILETYVNYFITIGKIKDDRKKETNTFRINRFLNEVPTYSKDKQGTNISILILHILFLLHQEKFGEIIDRVESLNMYVHRYLRRDDTYRSNCFIKMLLQLPPANFHILGVQRKAKKYLDMLKEVPLSKSSQSAEVEIVPYEVLWDCVLRSLDHKFH